MTRRTRFACLLCIAQTACGGGRVAAPTPADIPSLEAATAANPADGESALRLAEALLSAGRCEEALPIARRQIELHPRDARGALVAGACLEAAGEDLQALAVYDAFVSGFGDAPGAPAVAGRALSLRRSVASSEAQRAIALEAELSASPVEPDVIAVLPVEIVGDSAWQPFSAGLAAMIISDLDLLDRFRIVERIRIDAIVREIALGLSGVTDAATAIRTGRLLRAKTLIQSVALIPSDGRVRLQFATLDASGRVIGSERVTGELGDLLSLEKQAVLALAATLGYQVSEAERRAIMDNGTANLAAFLAFSHGLLEQDAGHDAAAAAYFAGAVRQDPHFGAARRAHRAAAGAAAQAGPGESPRDTRVADPGRVSGGDAATAAASTAVAEIAPMIGDRLGGGVGTRAVTTAAAIAPPLATAQPVTFGLRIYLDLP